MQYYKFYTQKEADKASVKEWGADFGFYEMECKFYGGNAVKDVAKRDWYDEDGDDEFIPSAQKYKAFEMTAKFGFRGGKYAANDALKVLQDYLNGGTIKFYDSYNAVGRKNVRFLEISDDAELVRSDSDGDILCINVKMKVNDPRTEVRLEMDEDGLTVKELAYETEKTQG